MERLRQAFMSNWTPVIIITLLILLNSGCASFSKNVEKMGDVERAWHVLHLIDTAQTLNMIGDPCYKETDPLTRRLIGSNPNTEEVLAWSIATGYGHWWVSRKLERMEAPKWIQRSWQATTFVYATDTVYNNHDIGIRPWGSNQPNEAFARRYCP